MKLPVGARHSYIIYIGGDVACTGSNSAGELELGANDTTTPADVVLSSGASPNAQDVQVGHPFSCFQSMEGILHCMGINNYGQLGIGKDDLNPFRQIPTVVSLEGDQKVSMFAVGNGHTCAIDEDNQVQCWGGGRR